MKLHHCHPLPRQWAAPVVLSVTSGANVLNAAETKQLTLRHGCGDIMIGDHEAELIQCLREHLMEAYLMFLDKKKKVTQYLTSKSNIVLKS